MALTELNLKQMKPSNLKAIQYLILPLILAVSGCWLSINFSGVLWFCGQVILGFFFLQCSVLVHECGHYSFFKSNKFNTAFGYLFAFLSLVPFNSWIAIHNLHHKWTGWRDKDPTTEGTVSPKFGRFTQWLVNFCWLCYIPLFSIGYRLGNYWNRTKLIKYLAAKKMPSVYANQIVFLLMYLILFIFFGSWIIRNILFAYYISLVCSDLIILSQHSHIKIPIAGAKEIKPVKYSEQMPYTRSIALQRFIADYVLFNFNMHELHHVYPGLPGYYLKNVPLSVQNKLSFFTYLSRAKKMSGMQFIFDTGATDLNE